MKIYGLLNPFSLIYFLAITLLVMFLAACGGGGNGGTTPSGPTVLQGVLSIALSRV